MSSWTRSEASMVGGAAEEVLTQWIAPVDVVLRVLNDQCRLS